MNHKTVIEKLAAAGSLTPEQVERIGRNVNEMMSAMEDPHFMKEAAMGWPGMKEFGKTVGRQAIAILPASIAAVAVGKGMDLAARAAGVGAGAVTGAVKKKKGMEKMLEAHPDLKQVDQNRLKMHFDSLHRFSPEYAADPLVSGEYIKQTMTMEAYPLTTLKGAIEAGSKVRGRESRAPSEFMAKGAPQDAKEVLLNKLDDKMEKLRAGQVTPEKRKALQGANVMKDWVKKNL